MVDAGYHGVDEDGETLHVPIVSMSMRRDVAANGELTPCAPGSASAPRNPACEWEYQAASECEVLDAARNGLEMKYFVKISNELSALDADGQLTTLSGR